MICDCCLEEKKPYLDGLCEECADKIDRHIETTQEDANDYD